jgi:hypothetical protein
MIGMAEVRIPLTATDKALAWSNAISLGMGVIGAISGAVVVFVSVWFFIRRDRVKAGTSPVN